MTLDTEREPQWELADVFLIKALHTPTMPLIVRQETMDDSVRMRVPGRNHRQSLKRSSIHISSYVVIVNGLFCTVE